MCGSASRVHRESDRVTGVTRWASAGCFPLKEQFPKWKQQKVVWGQMSQQSVCSSGITAREHGSNKKLAAQSCALSLVRQLYHLGVIEAYSGVTKKKEGETVRLQRPADLSETLTERRLCLTRVVLCFVSSWRCTRSTCPLTCSSSSPVSSRSWESTSPHLWVTWATKLTTDQCAEGSSSGTWTLIWMCVIPSSLQTPAAQCLWFRGRWRCLSRHSDRAEPGSSPGRLRRSTGTPGPAATSTRDRWPSWVFDIYCQTFDSQQWVVIAGLPADQRLIRTQLIQESRHVT